MVVSAVEVDARVAPGVAVQRGLPGVHVSEVCLRSQSARRAWERSLVWCLQALARLP
jgi:hypothetical protein